MAEKTRRKKTPEQEAAAQAVRRALSPIMGPLRKSTTTLHVPEKGKTPIDETMQEVFLTALDERRENIFSWIKGHFPDTIMTDRHVKELRACWKSAALNPAHNLVVYSKIGIEELDMDEEKRVADILNHHFQALEEIEEAEKLLESGVWDKKIENHILELLEKYAKNPYAD